MWPYDRKSKIKMSTRTDGQAKYQDIPGEADQMFMKSRLCGDGKSVSIRMWKNKADASVSWDFSETVVSSSSQDHSYGDSL